MRIALLGLPQSGKRTLLMLLTGRAAPATRKAAEIVEGVAAVRDPRVDRLAELFQPRKVTYAENRFVLCPDVEDGGGREWYDDARGCELVCAVVRAFASDQVYHPAGSVDPARDRELLETEMVLADLERAMNRLIRIEKEKHRGPSAALDFEERTLRRVVTTLDTGQRLAPADFDADELRALNTLGLLTLLPVLWVDNVGEADPDHAVGPARLCDLGPDRARDPGARGCRRAERVSRGARARRGGPRPHEPRRLRRARAHVLLHRRQGRGARLDDPQGHAAPVAGGKIHSDIERGFIRVEVIKFDDLVAAGSEQRGQGPGQGAVQGQGLRDRGRRHLPLPLQRLAGRDPKESEGNA